MNTFVAIDLGQLPAPQIVEQIDYEQILAERKAYAVSLWPIEEQPEIAARLNMESEPLTKLLEENAYRETVWRQRVNEASVANMLALAKGTDLEQLAANFNVKRLVIQAANPTAVPPLPKLMESDDSLRERAQMAWEGLSTAGPRNSYIFHARSADGQVADATAESPAPAEAVVTVQSVLGDGTATQALLDKVKAYLSDDDRRPVADRLTVQGAEIINYQIKAKIYPLSNGPEIHLVGTHMADGVEARGNSVRVYFRFNGELCRELVPGGNTPENREHAKRLVTVIEYEIQAGTFDYRRHFPESTKLAENSFGHYLDLWLTIKSNSVAATSFRGYKNKAEVHVRPRWGDIQIDQIDHLDLQEWIQGPLSKRLKNKTIRDIISNVRQVFRLYRTRKKVAHDPTEGLFVRLPDPEAPDPFTRAEIKQILETPTHRTQELLMVQFMIWAGPRVSETIALAWEDVDLNQGTVTFRRSKVRGAYRVTKTRRSTRKVRLLEPAWDALRKLDAINQLKTVDTVEVVERDNKTVRKHKLHFVFLNTKSGLPHVSDFVVRDRFFKAHLKAAGVRCRGPGQCRHTYTSQLLTTGVASVDWIAEQMGHTSANMIRQHYGMWINEDGPDVIGMLQNALSLQPPDGYEAP